MHKLERDPNGPPCLRRYRHGRDRWGVDTPTSDEKAEIWEKLDAMQAQRCAYCETGIEDNGKRHIEHFRQCSRYPQGTFDWRNLFGSCNRQDSCGKHKDRCVYNPDDLIKPDDEDPEHFFLFVSDGTIVVRDGLSVVEQRRAKETLRVFNLDSEHGPLRRQREREVAGYRQLAADILAYVDQFPAQEWLPLLKSELAATAHLPFATAIKHTLMPTGYG